MADEKRKPDDPEQSKRFIDTAIQVGADETESVADRVFKKVVSSKPPAKSPSQNRNKGE